MTNFSERDIIRVFSKKLCIDDLDDIARVGGDNVLKCDMLVSSTDVPPRMKPWQIARKSIVSCVSDFASKGARPTAALISIGIPSGTEREFITGLARGFSVSSKEFGVRIVGGDTNEASELVIDCCMFGTAKSGAMPARTGAKAGDVVVVSGPFGLSAAGLAIIMKGAHSGTAFGRRAVRSVLEPIPRMLFGSNLARFFSSSTDSSDGLAISLYLLAKGSKVDIDIDSIPAAKGLYEFASYNSLDADELVFHGGEEYEIVSTIPRSKVPAATAAAKRAGLKFYTIGNVRKGLGNVWLGRKKLENRGYVHFERR